MERMGHSSTRAALIYLHATSGRQGTLADAVSELASTARRSPGKKRTRSNASGTQVARRRDGTL
jgi:hypothetical protein